MAAFPVPTNASDCSSVVPFGLSLKKPRSRRSMYEVIDCFHPESRNVALPASIWSSKSGVSR